MFSVTLKYKRSGKTKTFLFRTQLAAMLWDESARATGAIESSIGFVKDLVVEEVAEPIVIMYNWQH